LFCLLSFYGAPVFIYSNLEYLHVTAGIILLFGVCSTP
jgi:hypothetical protein